MSDLEINIALAQSMGWKELTFTEWLNLAKSGFIQGSEEIRCSYKGFSNGRIFDYRDPVIFVAICKHWQLVANFEGWVSGVAGIDVIGTWQRDCIEKAAALTVIELVKRGRYEPKLL